MTLGGDVHRSRNGVELTIFGRSRLGCALIAAAGAGAAGHPDSDGSFAAFETTVLPPTGKYLPGDMCCTEAVRAIVLVVSLVPISLVPDIVAETLAPAQAVGAFEPINVLAVLKPLDYASSFLQSCWASAGPCRRIARVGVPVPHAAARFGIHQPGAALARRIPADLH